MTQLELISGNPRIFTISHDEKSLQLLKEYIEDYGYEYFQCDEEDIFEKIDEISPHLIFLDSENENITLASDLELLNIPVILIIGDNFDEIDELLTSNPYAYLLKPLERDEVQRSMAVAIKKHDQNLITIKKAENRIKEKNIELAIEKSNSAFLLILSSALIIIVILTRNATWLQWILLIPTSAMLFNSIVSAKKQKPVTPFDEKDLPFVSIFIPAHNEEHTIEATVRSICNCKYSKNGEINYEVIVINDGSTDNTGEILSNLKQEISQLKIVTRHPPRSGKGKGFVLNDALTLSKGEIIGVFDADTKIKSDYLMTIIPYLNGDIDGVQSRVKMFNNNENFLARMQHVEFASFGNTLSAKDNLKNTGFLGGNGQFVKKEAIIQSGRWDGFAVTEDLNLAIKIMLDGGKIRYCGECAVHQEAVTSWKAFFRQRVRWAIGNFETLFVYLPEILKAKIPISKKFNIIEHISFYSFNLLIFFGFLVTISNIISWLVFNDVTIIRTEAPFIIGILSVIAFFPGIIIALLKDKPKIGEFIKDIVKYYIYCFHLIPLFFMTMHKMMTRKERRWAKTEHKGDNT